MTGLEIKLILENGALRAVYEEMLVRKYQNELLGHKMAANKMQEVMAGKPGATNVVKQEEF